MVKYTVLTPASMPSRVQVNSFTVANPGSKLVMQMKNNTKLTRRFISSEFFRAEKVFIKQITLFAIEQLVREAFENENSETIVIHKFSYSI